MLKAKICDLINYGKIAHLHGARIMLMNDRIKLGLPLTTDLTIFHLDFTIVKDNYKEMYSKLVRDIDIYPKLV